ncbi:MAG TPA: RpiB/LacA/LacB family sugar-phosphate isomerase [Candidatus Paceibacterota bacterium]
MNDTPTLLITCDHAGFEDKQQLCVLLEQEGKYTVVDVGPDSMHPDDDYPLTVAPMCKLLQEALAQKQQAFGIIIARSGQGEAMVANRFKGIRAMVVNNANDEVVRLGRDHNNANVISLGTAFMTLGEIKHAIDIFVSTPFSNDTRHQRRIAQIDDCTIYE